MSVPATRVGAVTYPTDHRDNRSRHTCPRCGVTRQIHRTHTSPLCASCTDVVRTLDEEEVWR